MCRISLVDEAGVVHEAYKTMREPLGNVEYITGSRRELNSQCLTVSGRFASQIQKHIKHSSVDAVYQFLMSVGRNLEMHSAQDVFCRGGEEFFAHSHCNAVLRKLPFMEGFHEVSTRVLEHEWAKDFDTWQWFIDKLHGKERWDV